MSRKWPYGNAAILLIIWKSVNTIICVRCYRYLWIIFSRILCFKSQNKIIQKKLTSSIELFIQNHFWLHLFLLDLQISKLSFCIYYLYGPFSQWWELSSWESIFSNWTNFWILNKILELSLVLPNFGQIFTFYVLYNKVIWKKSHQFLVLDWYIMFCTI